MNFFELVNNVNKCEDRKKYIEIVKKINITKENFEDWINNVFSDNIDSFDMGKLPYLIDELYKNEDNLKFMLCCMLLEAACDKLYFATNLENYILKENKFEILVNTLTTIYDIVDNEIANCMSLIIINNDPKFEKFNEEQKEILIEATQRKLNAIYDYLKTEDINPDVFKDLEIIVDLACNMKNDEINKIIEKIDELGFNDIADLFIIKYKLNNNLNIIEEKINYVTNLDEGNLCILYEIMENTKTNDKYLKNITQEEIAKSNMIRWLEYPTEIGYAPDKIELLGEIENNNMKYFVYKFSKSSFRIKDEMIGVSGGYPMNHISAKNSGYTFSNFETITDWKKQAKDIVNMISERYKEN